MAGYECSIPAARQNHLLYAEAQGAVSKNSVGKLIIDIGYRDAERSLAYLLLSVKRVAINHSGASLSTARGAIF